MGLEICNCCGKRTFVCESCGEITLLLLADDDGAYAEQKWIADMKSTDKIRALHKDSHVQMETTWAEVLEVDELIGSKGETYYRLPLRFFGPITNCG